MSEWEAHVYCTCFQEGLTSEPPYPRSELTVNRFGVVTSIGSIDHAKDPDDLWNWRGGFVADGDGLRDGSPPCAHDHMELAWARPFYLQANWRRMESAYPQVEEALRASAVPVLNEVFYRHPSYDYPSGGIWLPAEEAAPALAEMSVLLPGLPTDLRSADAYFIRNLQSLLEASVQTGNPIICHNNGVGDGAW